MKKPTLILGSIISLLLLAYGTQQFIAYKAVEAELAKAKKVEAEIRQLEENLKTIEEAPADLEAQIEKLKRENKELHRLRNEVRQLRQQTNSLAQVKERHSQLVASLEQSQQRGNLDTESLGFISKDRWKNAGMRNPTAAVTTIFHYLSAGNVEALASLTHIEDQSQNPLNGLSDEKRAAASETMREFTNSIHAFRIARQDQTSDEAITMHIQTALDGEAIPVAFQKVGQEWKIDLKASQVF